MLDRNNMMLQHDYVKHLKDQMKSLRKLRRKANGDGSRSEDSSEERKREEQERQERIDLIARGEKLPDLEKKPQRKARKGHKNEGRPKKETFESIQAEVKDYS